MAARIGNWRTAYEMPHEAIENNTFLSFFKMLTSLFNSAICVVSGPALLKFLIASLCQILKLCPNQKLKACITNFISDARTSVGG